MWYILIGLVLLFDYSIFKMASKCSKVEEKLEVEMNLEKKI